MNSDSDPSLGLQEEIAQFFAGDTPAYELFERVAIMIATLGPSEIRVSRSQVAFRHGRTFALVWRPAMYVSTTVPIVLSIAMSQPIASARFKEVVHPSATTWMHHLELRDASEVDDEVREWLAQAREAAGAARGV